MSQVVFPLWKSMVPGLRNKLLVKMLHIEFWERKQDNLGLQIKALKIKVHLCRSYSDETPHRLWDTLWSIIQKHPSTNIILALFMPNLGQTLAHDASRLSGLASHNIDLSFLPPCPRQALTHKRRKQKLMPKWELPVPRKQCFLHRLQFA